MEVTGGKAKRTAANTIAPHPNADRLVPSSQNAEQDAETFHQRGAYAESRGSHRPINRSTLFLHASHQE